jgi:type I restriction enzyme S subunit
MSEIKDIPKHWEIKKLGEVCGIVYGKGLPVKELKPSGFPVFGANGVIGFNDKYLFEEPQVLISCRGAASGKINLSPPKCYVTNNSLVLDIKHKNELDRNYLFYALSIAKKTKLVTGTAQPQVTINNAVELDICYPPLSEQQAIVAKIEELLSELDNGKQQLLTAQQQLKVYRQSLLNLLVTGKSLKTIDSVILKLDQGWSPRCLNENSTDDTEWAVIKTSAVQHGHFVPFENKILPRDLKPREQHELNVGDILITRAGPRVRVGVCCMVRKTRPRLINCDKVYRIKVNTKIVSPEYFELILNTPFYQREIEKMKSGISDSGLNLTQSKFLKIEIPIPTIKEQQQIVEELESKLTVCDKIEETISQSLQQAETLRQSILKKAFEGRLV